MIVEYVAYQLVSNGSCFRKGSSGVGTLHCTQKLFIITRMTGTEYLTVHNWDIFYLDNRIYYLELVNLLKAHCVMKRVTSFRTLEE